VAEIEQTQLPGVGVRYEFTTADGLRIGVVHHRAGRRELFVCTPEDPDSAIVTLDLSDDEVHDLVDVLGGSRVVENLSHLQQQIEGLAIDWITVDPDSAFTGRTIGDARLRTQTGASVVAVIRDGTSTPAPGPETEFRGGDVLVVVGTAKGLEAVVEILRPL
jgi:TrkA domain protein